MSYNYLTLLLNLAKLDRQHSEKSAVTFGGCGLRAPEIEKGQAIGLTL